MDKYTSENFRMNGSFGRKYYFPQNAFANKTEHMLGKA